MKKVFLTLMAACMAMGVMAVERPKQGFGVQIGWAQPIIRLNSPYTNYPKDSLANTVRLKGVKVGIMYDASYAAGFGSTIGLNYTFGASQGQWEPLYPNNQYPRSRMLITYHQMELFVDWQYKFEIAKETYLMLYTGPTIQYGIGFKMRFDSQNWDPKTDEITTEHGEWYSAYGNNAGENTPKKLQEIEDNNTLRHLNVTWGVGAGFQYKRYFIRGGYDFGLINPYKHQQFVNQSGDTYDRYTRGRLDQWNIRLGVYIWYKD